MFSTSWKAKVKLSHSTDARGGNGLKGITIDARRSISKHCGRSVLGEVVVHRIGHASPGLEVKGKVAKRPGAKESPLHFVYD